MKNLSVLLFMLVCLTTAAQNKLMLNGGVNISKVTPNYTMHPDTVTNTSVTQRSGLTFGFSAYIPIYKNILFNPGVNYTGNGSKVQQNFDTSTNRLYYLITEQKINYINLPLNVIYQVPIKGKTKFLIGAGPQLSLFYNGEIKVTSYDTARKFKEEQDKDPLVGKGDNKYRTFYLSANALAGFDFGRISLMANYSKGLSAFYNQESQKYKFNNLSFTLGIGLNGDPDKKPVVKDKDKDGIPDNEDACPTVAGPALTNGCPDSDGDGIADKDDKCPTIAGLKKYNGCPVPDTDKDGINDEEDKCPNVPGPKENNGCPVEEAKPVKPAEPEQQQQVISEKAVEQIKFKASQIQFKFRQAELTNESLKVLDEIAELLKGSNQKIMVEGHSSLEGNPKSNMTLSEQRAASVKKYLIDKGIAPERITAIGYGSTRPLMKGMSEKANVQNRRVEIKLID